MLFIQVSGVVTELLRTYYEETDQALVETACEISFAKSSKQVTGGQVSRQTVMRKIQESEPPRRELVERRSVRVLHVDANKDHVKLQGGRGVIVPLISVYEGVERKSGCQYETLLCRALKDGDRTLFCSARDNLLLR